MGAPTPKWDPIRFDPLPFSLMDCLTQALWKISWGVSSLSEKMVYNSPTPHLESMDEMGHSHVFPRSFLKKQTAPVVCSFLERSPRFRMEKNSPIHKGVGFLEDNLKGSMLVRREPLKSVFELPHESLRFWLSCAARSCFSPSCCDMELRQRLPFDRSEIC